VNIKEYRRLTQFFVRIRPVAVRYVTVSAMSYAHTVLQSVFTATHHFSEFELDKLDVVINTRKSVSLSAGTVIS